MCRGLCLLYKTARRSVSGFGAGVKIYENGIKRCTNCQYFIPTTEIMCGCCGKPYPYTSKGKKRTNDLVWFSWVKAGDFHITKVITGKR